MEATTGACAAMTASQSTEPTVPSTCIVVPCYNEAKRFPKAEFINYLSLNHDLHFCFVNDGSNDGTAEMLDILCRQYPEQLTQVHQAKNGGKAEAVRAGVRHAVAKHPYAYVGYLDADLATPLSEIQHLIDEAEKRSYILTCGSRIKRLGADIQRSSGRHYVGRVFATLASIALGLSVYDTQCGAKIIRSDHVDILFGQAFCSKWLFDIEIFARLIKKYGRTKVIEAVLEVPLVAWEEKGDSKVRFIDGIAVPLHLWRIRKKYDL